MFFLRNNSLERVRPAALPSLPREVEVGPLRLLRSLIYIFCLFSHKLDVVHSLCFLFVCFFSPDV